MGLHDLLIAPFAEFAFMRRAIAGAVALAIAGPPLGVFLILRRMSLTGDAMAHAILPGAALGYFAAGLSLGPMTIGGLAAGLIVAAASGVVARTTILREDASLAAFYLISLALGVTIISLRGSNIDLLHVLLATKDENGRYHREFRTEHDMARIFSGRDDERLAGAYRAAMEEFATRGLLTRTQDGWDVSHEALIRNWQAMRKWVDDGQANALRDFGEHHGEVREDQLRLVGKVFGLHPAAEYPERWAEEILANPKPKCRTNHLEKAGELTSRRQKLYRIYRGISLSPSSEDHGELPGLQILYRSITIRRFLTYWGIPGIVFLAGVFMVMLSLSTWYSNEEIAIRNASAKAYAIALRNRTDSNSDTSRRGMELRAAYWAWKDDVEARQKTFSYKQLYKLFSFLHVFDAQRQDLEKELVLTEWEMDWSLRQVAGRFVRIERRDPDANGRKSRILPNCIRADETNMQATEQPADAQRRIALVPQKNSSRDGRAIQYEVELQTTVDGRWKAAETVPPYQRLPVLYSGDQACLLGNGAIMTFAQRSMVIPTIFGITWDDSGSRPMAILNWLSPGDVASDVLTPATESDGQVRAPVVLNGDSGNTNWVEFARDGYRYRAEFESYCRILVT